MAVKRGLVFKQGRAIGADSFRIVAHVDENMRMIEGRQRADAHEFLRAHTHERDTRLVVEMGRGMFSHGFLSVRSKGVQLLRTISEGGRLG